MKRVIIASLLFLCLAGCRKLELYHDLSEEDANDMIVILQSEGINASKEKEIRQNEVFWTVKVDIKNTSDARRVLVEHNLPRKREAGLSGVYKEKGLIPTPDEQKARFLLALKGEIINSLLKIPDVVDADVVLNTPSPEEFADPNAREKRPTASIVVKAMPSDSGQETLSESKLQQFVANAVENLNPRDVSVIITYITPPKRGLLPGQTLILPNAAGGGKQLDAAKPISRIAGLDVVEGSQTRLRVYLVIFFIVLIALAAALVLTVIRTSRMRQELEEFKGTAGGPALPEGKSEDRPKLTSGS